jgi:spermidine dehydrogenase
MSHRRRRRQTEEREQLNDDERRRLGLGAQITRRDFVNGVLVGAGGALMSAPSTAAKSQKPKLDAPQDTFTGYGGVGDYARANGNTWPVVQAAHRIRDGVYDAAALAGARQAGEFDLVVVGGGIAGLSAAHYFLEAAGRKRVLLLENHAMPGGEARQNELVVSGERLLAPQGSNDFAIPAPGTLADAFFRELALPREYAWQSWDAHLKPLRFARDNYSNMDGFQESQVDVGYFFGEGPDGKPLWRRNIWDNGLEDAPFSEGARRDLLHWRANNKPVGDAENRYLDTLTYKDYLEKVHRYDPAVSRMVEPIIGLLSGVSTDAASARVGRQLVELPGKPLALSFPGGNSPFPRALLRALLPEALPGKDFNSLLYGGLDFAALDGKSKAQTTRMRLEATVLRVEHTDTSPRRGSVQVTYEKGGELFRVAARTVVMASGGWVNKHILADMPDDLRAAYEEFAYAPALIVNVALRQWRFLYDLDVTACRWFDEPGGFGYCCNLRQSMTVNGHAPPLHPDRPAVLTFYMGLPIPGLPAAQQGATARAKLLGMPYWDLEVSVRKQMTRMFGPYGLRPEHDIAAIVLNRWGHARLVEPPGFHYGRDGKPSPLERVRAGYGQVSIGHSELNGAQHWGSALEYGKKAGERAAALL